MMDLELLDAEHVGFDPMDLLRAVPSVLQATGDSLAKPNPATDNAKKAEAPKPTAAPAPEGIGLGWKIGGAAVAGVVLFKLLKR